MKKIICIPVYNESHRLDLLIDRLNNSKLKKEEIIFVNDGSNDGSDEIIKKNNYSMINVKYNMGVGHSLIKGIEYAKKNNFDLFGVLSSNGKMLPNEIYRLLNPIIENKYDFINGSRFINNQIKLTTPLFRRFMIRIISKIISLLIDKKITDFSCGCRCFNLKCLDKIKINLNDKKLFRYRFESELYSRVLLSKDIKFNEVGISMNYPIDKKKYTKIKPILDWYTILFPIFYNILKSYLKKE